MSICDNIATDQLLNTYSTLTDFNDQVAFANCVTNKATTSNNYDAFFREL